MMSYTRTINLLQKALNLNCHKVILVEHQQFFSEQQKRVITMFVLYERVFDEIKGKYIKQEVLKTASQIDVVKYMSELYKKLREEQS